jgi:sulfate adenylyltransferase
LLSVTKSHLITPYGEQLVDLSAPADSIDELKARASQLSSLQISPRSASELEMLANGAFSPLDRFMGQNDYERVLSEMRLADGTLYPIPITLPVAAEHVLHLDTDIAIRNNEFELLAIMTIEEIYERDQSGFPNQVFSSQQNNPLLVDKIQGSMPQNISGRIQVLKSSRHYEFQELWLTPDQMRTKIACKPDHDVIAAQPIHITNPDLSDLNFQEIEEIDGIVLLQLAVGNPKLGDRHYFSWINNFQQLAAEYLEPDSYLLSILPLFPRYGDLREMIWQAIIQRNYGASHLVIGGKWLNHKDSIMRGMFMDQGDAYKQVIELSREIGMNILPSNGLASNQKQYLSSGKSTESNNVSLDVNSPVSERNYEKESPWNKFQIAVVEKLFEAEKSNYEKGVCIWFTGLSGSGKSTTTEILAWNLLEYDRKITVLDGDVVRTNLSKGLGFSKADRDINVRRIGFVASELVRLGGVVICAVVSPYRAARNDVRNMMGKDQFVEVYVNTPLEVCEKRDVKGFYAKARREEILGFTGIDDPYEPPIHPELVLDTVSKSPEKNAQLIIDYLMEQGFIQVGGSR